MGMWCARTQKACAHGKERCGSGGGGRGGCVEGEGWKRRDGGVGAYIKDSSQMSLIHYCIVKEML